MAELMAEFSTPEALVGAVRALRQNGVQRITAFTPYSVPELDHVLQLPKSWIAPATLIGGLVGTAFGFGLQLYLNAFNFPLAIGGFPPTSPLAFIPITFESMVLFSVLTASVSLFIATRLPKLWHPVFEVEEFRSVTNDGFWVAVDVGDPRAVSDRLQALGATRIVDAPAGVT